MNESSDSLVLTGDNAVFHMDQIDYILKEASKQCHGQVNADFLASYISKISNTLKFYRYERSAENKFGTKHHAQKEFEEDKPKKVLSVEELLAKDKQQDLPTPSKIIGTDETLVQRIDIDPNLSGFPNYMHIKELCSRQTLAENNLEYQDPVKVIIANAREKILAGKLPKKEQDALAEIIYFQEIQKTQLTQTMDHEVHEIKELDKGLKIKLGIHGVDPMTNLYTYFLMDFVYQGSMKKFEETKDQTITFLYENTFGYTAYRSFIGMNDHGRIKPISVDRYAIGPLFNRNTNNNEIFNSILKKEPEGFIFTLFHQHADSMKSYEVGDDTSEGFFERISNKISSKFGK
ncbi:hypothetical protein HN814_10550, partial [Candidatus Woesearchaeota archaeon]|nr:hypothetical protein [Candidatus Woesearchaeota archaeon]